MSTHDLNLIHIPIEKIEKNPLNVGYEIGDLKSIKASLLVAGLLTPLSVIGPSEDGIYRLISGERRLTAITELLEENEQFNLKEIPCTILGDYDMSSEEQQIRIDIANVENRDEDMYDKNAFRFRLLQNLFALSGKDSGRTKVSAVLKDAAQYFSHSERYSRMYVRIFQSGSDELLESVKNKEILVSRGANIAGFEPEIQNRMLDESRSDKEGKKYDSKKLDENYQIIKELKNLKDSDDQTSAALYDQIKEDNLDIQTAGEILNLPEESRAEVVEALNNGEDVSDAIKREQERTALMDEQLAAIGLDDDFELDDFDDFEGTAASGLDLKSEMDRAEEIDKTMSSYIPKEYKQHEEDSFGEKDNFGETPSSGRFKTTDYEDFELPSVAIVRSSSSSNSSTASTSSAAPFESVAVSNNTKAHDADDKVNSVESGDDLMQDDFEQEMDLSVIVAWCNAIVRKDAVALTDSEIQTLSACKDAVNHFITLF